MLNKTEYTGILQYNFISQQITKYAGILLYLLCLLGTVMNILTFMRQTYNSRPCSLYLLVASIFDLIHLNLGPLSNILQYGFHFDWTITSITFCKIKSYLTFVFAIMSATLTAMACIDRYILSSRKITRWKYCTRHIAVQTIQWTGLLWFILSIPIPFCYTRFGHSSHNEQLICSNPSHGFICFLIQILYICIFNGFLHPLITMIFGLLTCTNINHLRRRSLFKSMPIEKINDQLTSMLVLQLIKSSFSSLPFAVFNCYLLFTRNMKKSSLYQAKENLVNQIFYLFFWSNYTSFFVYIYASDIFRSQWIKSMNKIVYCFRRQHQRRHSSRPETNRLTVS
jgi:hypothetical protein